MEDFDFMQDIVEKFNIANKFQSKNYNLAHFNKILSKVSKTQERPYPKYENAFPLNFRYSINLIINL